MKQKPMKSTLKRILLLVCDLVLLPAVLVYRIQSRIVGRDRSFSSWAQFFCLLPGIAGVYARAAFFRRTMRRFDEDAWVSFGTIFSHADVSIGRSAYIGNYCCIGAVTIEDDVLIASGVSIMNGCRQHGIESLEIPIREQAGVYEPVTIGYGSWVGEKATVAASVGRHCVIGAGSLVLKPVPDYSIVAGVPARMIGDRRNRVTRSSAKSCSKAAATETLSVSDSCPDAWSIPAESAESELQHPVSAAGL
jgi:virginiamycin A acetyltransferase